MSSRKTGATHEKEVEKILQWAGLATERARNVLVFARGRAFSIRHDYWHSLDLVALHPDLATVMIQVTTAAGQANAARLRRRKIEKNLLGKVGGSHLVQLWTWGKWPSESNTGSRKAGTYFAFRVHEWSKRSVGEDAWTWIADLSKKGRILRHRVAAASGTSEVLAYPEEALRAMVLGIGRLMAEDGKIYLGPEREGVSELLV